MLSFSYAGITRIRFKGADDSIITISARKTQRPYSRLFNYHNEKCNTLRACCQQAL